MYFNNCVNSSINKTFIIEPLSITGGSPTLSACTGIYTNEVVSCDGDATIVLGSGSTTFNTNIVPDTDNTLSIGVPTFRFRELNTYSGNTTLWVVQNRVETPELRLGLDSSGYTRTITANNSVIQNDILNGGGF
jgi:hypothetical protein